ncbi:unnamed protein product [Clavelina lepadiformis]|uniref:Coiled-coil domain-containing protein 39 n=1 Tax=Clavelina lepadiformis TaxID=159417 RepID=A0ABP0FE25_CLALP
MVDDWRNSIKELQDILKKKICSEKSTGAQEHLESLIKCIKDLTESRQELVQSFEETTIKASELKSRYKMLEMKQENDLKTVVEGAKQQNKDTIETIKQNIADVNKKMIESEQKHKRLNLENEVLLPKAEKANEMWPALCQIISDTMKTKAQLQMNVNETRCKTIDVHEKAISFCEETEAIELEIVDCWEVCRAQIDKVNKEGETWKEEIAAQDNVTLQAKKDFIDLEEDISWSQLRNVKASEQLKKEEGKLTHLRRRTKYLQRKIKQTEKEKFQEEKALKVLKQQIAQTTENYEEKMESLTESHQKILQQAREAFREKEELSIQKDTISLDVEAKRFQLETIKDEKKGKRNALLQVNSMLNLVVSDLTANRSERSKFQEMTALVIENSEETQKVFAKNIKEMKLDLEEEIMKRENAREAWVKSLDLLNSWNEKMVSFFESSKNSIEENRRRGKAYKEENDVLRSQLEGMKIRESGLRLQIEEGKQLFKKTKKTLSDDIFLLKESIKEKTENIKELQALKDKLKPGYGIVREEFERRSSSYKSLKDDLILLKRTEKELTNAIELKNIKFKGLYQPREDMKVMLSEARKNMLECIKRHKKDLYESGYDIYMVYKHIETLYDNNSVIRHACGLLQRQVADERKDISSADELIQKNTTQVYSIRERLLKLVEEELKLMADASLQNSGDLSQLAGIKANAQARGSVVYKATRQMLDLVQRFGRFVSAETKSRRKSRRMSKIEKVEKQH